MADHTHTPAFLARADQAAAGFNAGVDELVATVCRYFDEGDDDMHAAASLAQNMAIVATVPQLASLLGFAVVRLARQKRAGRMSDAEYAAWQAARDVFDERTRDAATPPSTQEDQQ